MCNQKAGDYTVLHCHCYRFLYSSVFIRHVRFSALASISPRAIQISVESQGFIVSPAILLSVSTATFVWSINKGTP